MKHRQYRNMIHDDLRVGKLMPILYNTGRADIFDALAMELFQIMRNCLVTELENELNAQA